MGKMLVSAQFYIAIRKYKLPRAVEMAQQLTELAASWLAELDP